MLCGIVWITALALTGSPSTPRAGRNAIENTTRQMAAEPVGSVVTLVDLDSDRMARDAHDAAGAAAARTSAAAEGVDAAVWVVFGHMAGTVQPLQSVRLGEGQRTPAPVGASDGLPDWHELLAAYPWPLQESMAVLMCESGGDPLAVNGTSVGLFQINWPYHGYAAPDALFDPAVNVAEAFTIWSDQGWEPWACKPWPIRHRQ